MKFRFYFVFVVMMALLFALPAFNAFGAAAEGESGTGAEEEYDLFEGTNPMFGPTEARIGSQGKIAVPEGYIFFDDADTKILMDRMENLVNDQELGMIIPEDFAWFIVFEFDPVGYVDDGESDIDEEALLEYFQEGVKAGNEEEKARGWPVTSLVGWTVKPHYNKDSHNLEWGIKYFRDGDEFENYNLRILGREGVMEVVLAGDTETYEQAKTEVRELLRNYNFTDGKSYAEFTQGDKTAGYGLTALVAGGAVAVAAKSGILGKLLKPLLIGLAAAGAFLINLFRRKKK